MHHCKSHRIQPSPIRFLLVWVGMMVALYGCKQPENSPKEHVIAKVGDAELTRENTMESIPRFMLEQDTNKAIENFRSDWVRRQIIIQEAERQKLEEKPDVKKRLQRAREDVLAQSLKDAILGEHEDKLRVTRSEAQDYYEAHKDRFVLDERHVQFRHLVTNTLSESRQAKSDLMRGIDWRTVVEKYAVNKEMTLQNSTQFWPVSMALKDNPPMNQYLQVIGITEISPIRRVEGNYHFIQLMDERSKGTHPDIEWLLERIQEWLRISKRRKHFNSYVQNLYLNAEANNEITFFNVDPRSNSRSDTLSTENSFKSNYKDSLTAPL